MSRALNGAVSKSRSSMRFARPTGSLLTPNLEPRTRSKRSDAKYRLFLKSTNSFLSFLNRNAVFVADFHVENQPTRSAIIWLFSEEVRIDRRQWKISIDICRGGKTRRVFPHCHSAPRRNGRDDRSFCRPRELGLRRPTRQDHSRLSKLGSIGGGDGRRHSQSQTLREFPAGSARCSIFGRVKESGRRRVAARHCG